MSDPQRDKNEAFTHISRRGRVVCTADAQLPSPVSAPAFERRWRHYCTRVYPSCRNKHGVAAKSSDVGRCVHVGGCADAKLAIAVVTPTLHNAWSNQSARGQRPQCDHHNPAVEPRHIRRAACRVRAAQSQLAKEAAMITVCVRAPAFES